ncbi:nectin-4 [Pimephales promelas]|uniref:nectin-4 n=1 Tax=Pimephales promelas TaxID=90988 RepID=UPI001955A2F0|nr:nectin-4 [Pimephales promelas]KAG1932128.1 nectin-4 [Pimephales promelas]
MTNLLIFIGAMLFTLMVCVDGEFLDPPASLRSFSDTQTRLPCRFAVDGDEKVVQVTWSRQKPGGEREQIITGHFTDGPKASPDFLKRVRFESSDPTLDSTLLILNTKKADQATYTCHISTFPSGNFETHVSLTVWILPISSLDPVILQEGQSFRSAASCRSVAHPPPLLSWDTDVAGRVQNRSGEDGVVTSQFSLHPLRSMNGQRLDCLVWHPALDGPRRLSNTLVVHFPPDAEIVGSGPWRRGQVGSELRCVVNGNPRPQNISWSRQDGRLPESVSVQGERLVFARPLNVSDEGLYVCHTGNIMGTTKAQFKLEIGREIERRAGEWSDLMKSPSESLLIIMGASVVGALVLLVVITIVFVNCHLRRKNKKLKRALSARTVEMISLSRQVSMRRLDSITSDPRTAAEENSLIMNRGMKSSALSVSNHSILSDARGRLADGEFDSLGRPAIYPPHRQRRREAEEDERRRRVESYVKASNLSLDSGLHRDQSSPPRSVSSGPTAEAFGDAWRRGSRREIHREKDLRERIPEGEEGDSQELSEALSNYFQCSNSGLTPKQNPNAIIIHTRRSVL